MTEEQAVQIIELLQEMQTTATHLNFAVYFTVPFIFMIMFLIMVKR